MVGIAGYLMLFLVVSIYKDLYFTSFIWTLCGNRFSVILK